MSPPTDATHEALLEVIRTLGAGLEHERAEHAKDRAVHKKQLARLMAMVEGLTQQLDLLLKERDEERRAELVRLREEAATVAVAVPPEPSTSGDAVDAPTLPAKAKPKNRNEHGRGHRPDHLPRDVHTVKPERCTGCGSEKLLVGEVLVGEEYDFVRAYLRIRRTERTTCRCSACNLQVVPEQPPMPFDRVSCTFELMAWLCFAKCGLFLPLDRLMRDLVDQGAPIPSATLTRWWQRGADLLQPVAAVVRLSLLAQSHIRTDGTGLLVVFSRVKGTPVKGVPREGAIDELGYLVHQGPVRGQVLVFGDDAHAVYVFTPTKEGHHAMDFFTLGEDAEGKPILWKGTITADALNAHDRLFTDGSRLEAGCNAHGLRKFRDEANTAPLLASRAMGFIGGFYDVEAKATASKLKGAELLAYRQAHALPIAERFKVWLDEHIDDLLDTNPVRKAMQYYRSHWIALTRFLTDPRVELDNNWSERALRKIALLRNNSLYAGGIEGAERLCTLFTLINTCRLIGVDPYAYLVWAMTKSVPHSTNRGISAADLTPAAYKKTQQAAG